ncbi:uracil-DNA glycosylase [Phaeobacter gallaeciensis]|uniref:Uracil-DNA glycosylase n=1 Tax=Phaeobacter gallaeciensis TaxID=60890 RepID=A0AAD0ECT4_9RHOB|nr:uracil-DNA glycosylase [Phaeobacter gallaeciensis]AHD09412.1 Uracil-DNA glycosylase [Phaeobacter gallaeciensis DSM 26640]ATE92675.1 uracil-DNA glycosylase Ung [Phaeobacter gallaeciensis]ATE97503.1 uracil-DNA glycosylase Ung [Phaeobacter gallaeciensis]ATF01340.1 uracil-DNA glycosylase Ung [Phaeobacter gallaeciensis]ATF05720.1 uracil-DNA glycosylase Ung [Phaeobacter gallaeciensis]
MIPDLPDLGGWADLPFFADRYPAIAAAVAEDPRDILPPADQRLAALSLTPPEETRVVILGQDPYPTPGHAHGLAFSVEPDVRPLPRSLNNIFKELHDDLGVERHTGDLRGWARQGVLLLNTVLSVPSGEANGHKSLGWQQLAHEVLNLSSQRPTAYILWGKQAQGLEKYIQPGDHLILRTAHPSPLSARRGFFSSRPFSTVNRWLAEQGQPTIDWNA